MGRDDDLDAYASARTDGTLRSCGRCLDVGFLPVSDSWVDDHADVYHDRETVASCVYPCPACRPEVFARWETGMLAPRTGAFGVAARRRSRRVDVDGSLPPVPEHRDITGDESF